MTLFSGVRTFEMGPHMWWVLHYKDGVMSGLEEHDMRAGGCIQREAGRTWEEEFLAGVAGRIGSAPRSEVERAQAFLAEVQTKAA